MTDHHQYCLDIRFGDELLEAGFTSVPNLFLTRYRHLGISDAAAAWIIHLLRFKWTRAAPYPNQGGIPMSCNEKTRRRYARDLRRAGLLFTKRRNYTTETAPGPELVGKLQSLEYHLDSLFHNVVHVDAWLASKKPLDEFHVELPADLVRKVATNFFQDTPRAIKALCERHFADHPGTPLTLQLPDFRPVDTTNNLCPLPEFRLVETRLVETRLVEKRPGKEEDSSSKEDASFEEEEEEKAESNPAPAANPNSKVYELLSKIGIQEPNLSILAAHTTAQNARAWFLYVQAQGMPSWRGYLVNRLKHQDPPPAEFIKLATLTDDQLDTLASSSRSRRWAGSWQLSYDTLDQAGITEELAESWYQLCGKESD